VCQQVRDRDPALRCWCSYLCGPARKMAGGALVLSVALVAGSTPRALIASAALVHPRALVASAALVQP
jgi:hypothetical protein